MADVNYISPSSIMPQLGQVNIPGLAGAMLANQERDYRDTMDLQKFLSGVGAQKAQIGLEELVRDLPKKAIERERDIQGAGLDLMYKPGERGLSYQDKVLKSEFDTAVQPSKIGKTISDNEKGVSNNQLDLINSRLSHVMGLRDMLEDDDPTSLQRVLTHAQSIGMKETDPVYQHLARSGTPATLRERLSGMEKALKSQKESVWSTVYGKDVNAEVAETRAKLLYDAALNRDRSREYMNDENNRVKLELAQRRAQTDALKLAQRAANQNIEQRIVSLRSVGTPEAIKEAEELAALKLKLSSAKNGQQVALLSAMIEGGKEAATNPGKLMELFQQHMEKFNAVTGILTQQFSGVPQQGGGMGFSFGSRGSAQGPGAPGWSTSVAPPTEDGSTGPVVPPGGLTQERNMPSAMGRITPENEAQNLADLEAYLAAGGPGSDPTKLREALEDQRRRAAGQPSAPTAPLPQPPASMGTTQAAPAPQAPMPGNNPVNDAFKEFMKNRKKNEVPR